MRAQGIRGALDRHDHRCRAPWQRLPPHTPHAHFTRTLLYALLCNLCPQHTTSVAAQSTLPSNPPFCSRRNELVAGPFPPRLPISPFISSEIPLRGPLSCFPITAKSSSAGPFPLPPRPSTPSPPFIHPTVQNTHAHYRTPPHHPSRSTHCRASPPLTLAPLAAPPSLSLRFPPSPPTVFPPHSQARVGQL